MCDCDQSKDTKGVLVYAYMGVHVFVCTHTYVSKYVHACVCVNM